MACCQRNYISKGRKTFQTRKRNRARLLQKDSPIIKRKFLCARYFCSIESHIALFEFPTSYFGHNFDHTSTTKYKRYYTLRCAMLSFSHCCLLATFTRELLLVLIALHVFTSTFHRLSIIV